ncbi:helix-turn-helix domain-containing protein [Microbulbifer sp. CAU 1566]|uniref:helix-turn-helix transcriptional regulator n=1 Tax=Microbulbifer TaxID=48073 RepID=UPI0009909FD1|nr:MULTISPECIES: helix-turn-helix domain-containing protein [Microbulbifer]MCK7597075.1 helix-turn-helix domain-containing protein [Microbulbifer sp. CAU 1566]
METQNSNRAFTEIEAAKYIGMSRSYLAQARMDGRRDNRTPAPPFIKIGRAVRYLREDLDTWLNSFSKLEHLGQA